MYFNHHTLMIRNACHIIAAIYYIYMINYDNKYNINVYINKRALFTV